MTNENSTENNTEATEAAAAAEIAPPQKRRGTRKKQAELPAAPATIKPDTAQKASGRKKRTEKSTEAKSAKISARASAPEKTVKSKDPILEDIADLVQLEEENARLRKALAEKLRTENADLRKRLGLA
jgi:ribosome-binding protein aMBF1 (putative translation factor)